jgi:type IV pilus assembly protein PilV
MKHATMKSPQRGVALLEALIALLIFSLGILGLVGLQSLSIKNSTDAKYRADAAFLANQIISQIWADLPSNSLSAAGQAVLGAYAHRPNAGADACSPAGNASANGNVTGWITEVSRVLPGASSTNQQITVNAATGAVTVTVCWRATQETADHNHVVSAQLVKN